MTPHIWLLLLMFVLGAALTWFALVVTVRRDLDIVSEAQPRGATRLAPSVHRSPRPPRHVEMDDDDDDVVGGGLRG